MGAGRKVKQRDHIKAAAVAMSDLNVFAIVVTILEANLHALSFNGANRIIRICHAEQAKRLREYDRAMEAAGGGTYENPK